MIVVRCFRCQVTKTIVDEAARNCADCGGPVVQMTSSELRNPHIPRQELMCASGSTSRMSGKDPDASLATGPGHRVARAVEEAHQTSGSLSGLDPATSAAQQSRKAFCPGCGAPAVLNQSGSNHQQGEFQLICGNCDSSWNLRVAAACQTLAPPQFSQRGDSRQTSLGNRFVSNPGTNVRNPSQLLAVLTERQKEVMDLVVAGKANKQTAHILGLSEKTVERHRANLMRRLGLKNVVDLVRLHMLTTGQVKNAPASEHAPAGAGQQQSVQFPDQRQG